MDKQLFLAVKHGRKEKIRLLLKRGANINAKNSKGESLLHVAVQNDNIRMVEFLIYAGINVRLKNKKNQTARKLALKSLLYDVSSWSKINNRLTKGVIFDLLDTEAWYLRKRVTNWHEALISGNVQKLRCLIKKGADVNEKNVVYYGNTALHWVASSSQDPSMFELLLSANADVNAKNNKGQTPLHLLSTNLEPNILFEIVEMFYQHGADFNIEEENGYTPLHYAIMSSNTEMVKALVLIGGLDVNTDFAPRFEEKYSILHAACYYKDLPTVKFLLKNGANINALNYANISPLQRTVDLFYSNDQDEKEITKKMELLKYLLTWDPDVNTVTNEETNILTSHIPNLGLSLPDYVWKIIIRHIAKLSVMERPLSVSLIDSICDNQDYENYYDQCYKELEIIKNSKIHHQNWVTFFNIMVDDKRKLIQYAGNAEIISDWIVNEVKEKFPIYGDLIHEKMKKAKENRLIWDQAANRLCDFFPADIDPEHNSIRSILNYLNSKDLKKLCSIGT